MFVQDILLHWAFVLIWRLFYWVYHWGFVRVFQESFSLFESLSLSSWSGDSFIRSFASWIRVDIQCGYANLLLRSPNQCLLHYSIMSDTIFLCCIDMRWSSFFLLSHCLHLISHHFFLAIYSLFHPILTPMHIFDSTPFFTSFTWSIDGLTIFFCFPIDISIGHP